MANVRRVKGKFCVTHGKTGAVLVRAGKPACYATVGPAKKDAQATKRRNAGKC